MPFYETTGIKYFCFDSFQKEGLVQGVYTRLGGVSPHPWASLNLGGTVGDQRENVVENRKRIFDSAGLKVSSIYDPWQVHGTDVIDVTGPRPLDQPHQKADVILTNVKGITLFMRFADCVPILLYDPVRQVIGMVHAGWRGTIQGAAAEAVNAMVGRYQCSPGDIMAGIGPSICQDHYPVGAEVILAAEQVFESQAEGLVWRKNGSAHFNLQKANQLVLERAGIRQIEQANLCTACHNDDWFSHRAEHGKTGRFGALLAMTLDGE